MIVSFNVSPFEELVTLGSVNPMTRAPNLFAAVWLLFKLFCHLQEVEDFLFRVFGNSN